MDDQANSDTVIIEDDKIEHTTVLEPPGPDHDIVKESSEIVGDSSSDVVSLLKATLKLGDLARQDYNRDEIRRVNGITALLSLLKRIQDDTYANASKEELEKLNMNILRAFTNISFDHGKNARIICGENNFNIDVIQFAVDSVKKFREIPELARNACAALTNFAHDDDEIRSKIGQKGGILPLLSILSYYFDVSKNVQDDLNLRFHALRALENSAANDGVAKEIVIQDGLKIFKSILEQSEDEDVVLNMHILVIKVLGYIGQMKEESEKLGKADILQTLAAELDTVNRLHATITKRHQEEEADEADESLEQIEALILQIVETTTACTKSCEENIPLLLEPSSTNKSMVQELIAYTYNSSINVQESVMDLLAALVEKDQLQTKIVAQGLIPAVVQSILRCVGKTGGISVDTREVTSHSRLLRFSIKAVAFLALQDENLKPLIEQGAVQALIGALNLLFAEFIQVDDITSLAQQMNVYIQRNTCIALGNLARTDENCITIVKENGVVPLANIMALGWEPGKVDQNLIANAAFAFNNLTKPVINKQIILQTSVEQRKSVLKALYELLHQESPFVLQFYAADALANLSLHIPANATAIIQYPNDVENHQEGISANVQRSEILERLLAVLQSRKDKMKLRYAVVKALVNMSESHDSISALIVNRLRKDLSEFKDLITEMEKVQETKIQQMAAEALKKLGISDEEDETSTYRTETTTATRESDTDFTEETEMSDISEDY